MPAKLQQTCFGIIQELHSQTKWFRKQHEQYARGSKVPISSAVLIQPTLILEIR